VPPLETYRCRELHPPASPRHEAYAEVVERDFCPPFGPRVTSNNGAEESPCSTNKSDPDGDASSFTGDGDYC